MFLRSRRRVRVAAPFFCTLAIYTFPSLLLLVRNGLLRALAGTRVGLGALAADRQAATVTQAAVAADFNQALDIQTDFAAQVALNIVVAVDHFTQLSGFFFGQVLYAGVRIDTGLLQDLVGRLAANAEDVGQADLHALLAGKVNTGNTCH